VRVLYFASLRENLSLADESISEPVTSVSELLDLLAQRGQVWDEQLRQNSRLQIAVNQTMAKRETSIKRGDEIAFFPPVTGG
jgi:molybdopterin synthase sulfur carrier subunit